MNAAPHIEFAIKPAEHSRPAIDRVKMRAHNVNVYYDDKQALADVTVDIPERTVMAFIGPSG